MRVSLKDTFLLDFLVSQYEEKAAVYLIGVVYKNELKYFLSYEEFRKFLSTIKTNTAVYIPDLRGFVSFFKTKLYKDFTYKTHEDGTVTEVIIKSSVRVNKSIIRRQFRCSNIKKVTEADIDLEIGSNLYTEDLKTSPMKEDYELLKRRLEYMRKEVEKYGLDDPKNYKTSPAGFSRDVLGEAYDKLTDSEKLDIKERHKTRIEEYESISNAHQGGLALPNKKYLGKILKNVTSYDINSAYPSVMVNCLFPYKLHSHSSTATIDQILQSKYGSIFTVKFINLKANNPNIPVMRFQDNDTTFSGKNRLIYSGHYIIAADEVQITITNVDLDIITKFYTFDKCDISDIWFYEMAPLDKWVRELILTLYHEKSIAAKGSSEREVKKKQLNAIYGLTIPGYVTARSYYFSDRRLYRAWGAFITAYTRRIIARIIYLVGDDFVYCDTDSVKLLNAAKYKNLFDVGEGLGQWKNEGTYELFKVFGAKRYLSIKNGKLDITYSGLDGQVKKTLLESVNDPYKIMENLKYGSYIIKGFKHLKSNSEYDTIVYHDGEIKPVETKII